MSDSEARHRCAVLPRRQHHKPEWILVSFRKGKAHSFRAESWCSLGSWVGSGVAGGPRSTVKVNSDSAERFQMPARGSTLRFLILSLIQENEGPGGKINLWNLHQTPQKGLAPTAAFWGPWPVLY